MTYKVEKTKLGRCKVTKNMIYFHNKRFSPSKSKLKTCKIKDGAEFQCITTSVVHINSIYLNMVCTFLGLFLVTLHLLDVLPTSQVAKNISNHASSESCDSNINCLLTSVTLKQKQVELLFYKVTLTSVSGCVENEARTHKSVCFYLFVSFCRRLMKHALLQLSVLVFVHTEGGKSG